MSRLTRAGELFGNVLEETKKLFRRGEKATERVDPAVEGATNATQNIKPKVTPAEAQKARAERIASEAEALAKAPSTTATPTTLNASSKTAQELAKGVRAVDNLGQTPEQTANLIFSELNKNTWGNTIRSFIPGKLQNQQAASAGMDRGTLALLVNKLGEFSKTPEYAALPLKSGRLSSMDALEAIKGGNRIEKESFDRLTNDTLLGKSSRWLPNTGLALKAGVAVTALGIYSVGKTVDLSGMGIVPSGLYTMARGAFDKDSLGWLTGGSELESHLGLTPSQTNVMADQEYDRLIIGGAFTDMFADRVNEVTGQDLKAINKLDKIERWSALYNLVNASGPNSTTLRDEHKTPYLAALSRTIGMIGSSDETKTTVDTKKMLAFVEGKYKEAVSAALNGATPEDIAFRNKFLKSYYGDNFDLSDDGGLNARLIIGIDKPALGRKSDFDTLSRGLIANYLQTKGAVQKAEDLMDNDKLRLEQDKARALSQTQMFERWGEQNAQNANEDRNQNGSGRTPKLSEAFNTARVLFEDVTKDDTYGVKGQEKVIENSWAAAVRQNALDLGEFEKQLKARGINQVAIPVIVDYAKMSVQP
jgi:hypothetical protein